MNTKKLLTTSPNSPFPLLPLRNGVLFPGTVLTIPVGRDRSRKLVETLEVEDSIIGIAVQRDPQIVDPTIADLQPVGTYARVRQITSTGQSSFRLVVEGLGRFQLHQVFQAQPYWTAEGNLLEDHIPDPLEAELLAEAVKKQVREQFHSIAPEVLTAIQQWTESLGHANHPGLVADRIAAALGLETEKEIQILLTQDVCQRLRLVSQMIAETRAKVDLRKKIDQEVRRGLTDTQREILLRQQLKAIQKELGEEAGSEEVSGLHKKLENRQFPEEVQKVVQRELRRLEGLNQAQPEYNVIRTYLDWIAELPWDKRVETEIELDAIKQKLDQDHFGLEEVKKRIMEHMAVLRRSDQKRATILCLVGPPGVGKTSLGQSIADATQRPFVRIALGGVRDEAEIRGHRRTYIGALPGRLIHALKKAGCSNPIILLDEIDKLGQGWLGSPEAALLEVLDPEQNKHFTDHYLELPFDLSEVLFICTANDLSNISPPLRDRFEIIELTGYTADEKLHIAKQHLLPRLLKNHAIGEGTLAIQDETIHAIIQNYTREAGVRQLNRELTKICRAITLKLEQNSDEKIPNIVIDAADLRPYLGRIKFIQDVAERGSVPGVAIGLAWTPVGGDILFIETSSMPGKGRLETTGKLGEIMQESARAALTYVRSHATSLGIDPNFLEKQDLHIHIPAGAIPKDGPSAGVTIFTAITSLVSGRSVRPETAMTGECTLRGRVLPVGGIKSKVLAAHRAGIKRVILPTRNATDLDEVPQEIRDTLEFILVDDMSEVLAAALQPADLESVPLSVDLTATAKGSPRPTDMGH